MIRSFFMGTASPLKIFLMKKIYCQDISFRCEGNIEIGGWKPSIIEMEQWIYGSRELDVVKRAWIVLQAAEYLWKLIKEASDKADIQEEIPTLKIMENNSHVDRFFEWYQPRFFKPPKKKSLR